MESLEWKGLIRITESNSYDSLAFLGIFSPPISVSPMLDDGTVGAQSRVLSYTHRSGFCTFFRARRGFYGQQVAASLCLPFVYLPFLCLAATISPWISKYTLVLLAAPCLQGKRVGKTPGPYCTPQVHRCLDQLFHPLKKGIFPSSSPRTEHVIDLPALASASLGEAAVAMWIQWEQWDTVL